MTPSPWVRTSVLERNIMTVLERRFLDPRQGYYSDLTLRLPSDGWPCRGEGLISSLFPRPYAARKRCHIPPHATGTCSRHTCLPHDEEERGGLVLRGHSYPLTFPVLVLTRLGATRPEFPGRPLIYIMKSSSICFLMLENNTEWLAYLILYKGAYTFSSSLWRGDLCTI